MIPPPLKGDCAKGGYVENTDTETLPSIPLYLLDLGQAGPLRNRRNTKSQAALTTAEWIGVLITPAPLRGQSPGDGQL